MQKQTGAIMLVAGTCIGGGTIALPMVLAKIGIIPSIIFMIIMWRLVYYSAVINLELHLQAPSCISLGDLSRKFSGKIAENLANICFKLLSFALLAVYIYGASSILQALFNLESLSYIASIYAIFAIVILIFPLKLIDLINRFLFIGLLVVIALLIIGLILEVDFHAIPNISEKTKEFASWQMLIPIVFTSFGFQGSIPAIVKYCNGDKKMLKKVFFWGSLIPALIYIIWTCSILCVIYSNNNDFYDKIVNGTVEVGELVQEISSIAHWNYVQVLVWWISFLAIVTSSIGVSIGLSNSIASMIQNNISADFIKKVIVAILTVFPAYICAIYIPNAFITVLGFAGMILVAIAIFLPLYLLSKVSKLICSELSNSFLVGLVFLGGIVIVLCEILNIV